MLLIFDIDGTLCQTKAIGDNCFIEVFEEMHQCKLANIAWENFTNVTDTALYSDLYKMQFSFEPSKNKTQMFKIEYYKQLVNLTKTKADCFKETDGAFEFLTHCKQNNISIAIATGSWLDIALLKLNSCNMNFEEIPISSSDDDYRRTKIVKSVIEKSKKHYKTSQFTKIIYFGDGIWDYVCCQELEINFVGIDTDNTQKLKQAGAKKVVTNFRGLDLILNNEL